jgi:hypothetical protein
MVLNGRQNEERRHYQWPEEALEIVTRKGCAVSLCAGLKGLIGYSRRTCWAFSNVTALTGPVQSAGFPFPRILSCAHAQVTAKEVAGEASRIH